MVMNVEGRKPSKLIGKCFNRTHMGWHSIAWYCRQVAPASLKTDWEGWHSNDGHGLNVTDSKALATVLIKEIKSGNCAKFERQWKKDQKKAPDEPCFVCKGKGHHLLGAKSKTPRRQPCSHCRATGAIRPHWTELPFSVESVQEFAEFLKHCGGFKIR